MDSSTGSMEEGGRGRVGGRVGGRGWEETISYLQTLNTDKNLI